MYSFYRYRSNDSDPDVGDSLKVCSVLDSNNHAITLGQAQDLPEGGTLTIDENGCYRFNTGSDFASLKPGESRRVCFTYWACDESQESSEAVACIEISGTNTAPAAEDDSESTDAFIPVSSTMFPNDSDPEGDRLTVTSINGEPIEEGSGPTVISLPSGASLTVSPSGSYTFNPNGKDGTQRFTYTISDGNGGSDLATVTIVVEPPSNEEVITAANLDGTLPIAEDDSTDPILSNTSVTSNLLDNDTDPEDSPLTLQKISQQPVVGTTTLSLPTGALLTVIPNGGFTYDPNGQYDSLPDGETTTETIEYMVIDGDGGTAIATLTITLTGINDPPQAEDDSEITSPTMPVSSVMFSNDSDPEGDILTVTRVNDEGVEGEGSVLTLPSGAVVTVNTSGQYTYNPNGQFDSIPSGEEGTDTFGYTISDGNGGTDDATVTIILPGTPSPTPPPPPSPPSPTPTSPQSPTPNPAPVPAPTSPSGPSPDPAPVPAPAPASPSGPSPDPAPVPAPTSPTSPGNPPTSPSAPPAPVPAPTSPTSPGNPPTSPTAPSFLNTPAPTPEPPPA